MSVRGLTPSQKRAIQALTDEWQTSRELGTLPMTMTKLVKLGHAESRPVPYSPSAYAYRDSQFQYRIRKPR